MSPAQFKSDPPEHWKKWAAPEEFFEERTRPSKHHSEWTSNRVLYAHYQKWAHKLNLSAVEALSFGKRLRSACNKHLDSLKLPVPGHGIAIPLNGHLLYPIWIMDEPVKEHDDEDRVPPSPIVRGQVRMKRALQFLGETLEEDTIVDWMAPTPWEQQNLERLAKGDESMSWLVVVFNGKRRFIPGAAVERI